MTASYVGPRAFGSPGGAPRLAQSPAAGSVARSSASGRWSEMEAAFAAGGEQQIKEEYASPHANVALEPALLDTAGWTPPRWVSRQRAELP